ncbi:hypothetical protein PFISCL1PPCAC_19703, partial [Pristionchus fissidentatus]
TIQMVSTETELLFLRLLERTKRLNRGDVSNNIWKISSASILLDNFYSKMTEEKGIDEDVLMQYGKEVRQLKLVVDAHHKRSSEEKLSVLDQIPHGFPDISPIDTVDLGRDKNMVSGCKDEVIFSSSSGLRARSRAFYQADMRKQLLGEQKKHEEALTQERHDEMANELLSLTQSLKRNMQVTANVLKGDNLKLNEMNKDVDANREKLGVESDRLARNAYSCGFDCILIFIVVFVFWSFIALVIFIRVFPKPL